MSRQQVDLLEYVAANPGKVDRDAGVIRSVKILGAVSKNGRQYSPQALREAATFYEGLGVNANHPSRETPNINRMVQEGVGWLENVTVKPDGVFGDMHVIKAHPLAGALFEVAERKPDRFGLSHNASGECVTRQGKTIVESIKSVRSVDIVQNPATNHSLFESVETMSKQSAKSQIQAITANKKAGRGAKLRAIQSLLEMDALPPGNEQGETDRTDPNEMILKIVHDKSLSLEQKRDQISKILADMDAGVYDPNSVPARGAEQMAESYGHGREFRRRSDGGNSNLMEARGGGKGGPARGSAEMLRNYR